MLGSMDNGKQKVSVGGMIAQKVVGRNLSEL